MSTKITITTKQGKALTFVTDAPGVDFVNGISDAMDGGKKANARTVTIGKGGNIACVRVGSIASIEAYEIKPKDEG